MIEFSFAELFLLAWAVLATVVAVSKAHEARGAKHFIHALMDAWLTTMTSDCFFRKICLLCVSVRWKGF